MRGAQRRRPYWSRAIRRRVVLAWRAVPGWAPPQNRNGFTETRRSRPTHHFAQGEDAADTNFSRGESPIPSPDSTRKFGTKQPQHRNRRPRNREHQTGVKPAMEYKSPPSQVEKQKVQGQKQESHGAGSPNIVTGDHSTVTINAPDHRPQYPVFREKAGIVYFSFGGNTMGLPAASLTKAHS